MQIKFLIRYSPVRGQRLEPGSVVDVEPEVAADLIQHGVAAPVRRQAEHAVAAGQEHGHA